MFTTHKRREASLVISPSVAGSLPACHGVPLLRPSGTPALSLPLGFLLILPARTILFLLFFSQGEDAHETPAMIRSTFENPAVCNGARKQEQCLFLHPIPGVSAFGTGTMPPWHVTFFFFVQTQRTR